MAAPNLIRFPTRPAPPAPTRTATESFADAVRGAVGETEVLARAAQHFGTSILNPLDLRPDVRLIDRVGVGNCLRHGLVPLSDAGGTVVVATAHPAEFHRLKPLLQDRLGTPVTMALAPASQIEAAIHTRRGAWMAAAAESRVAEGESCRNFGGPDVQAWWVFAGLALVAFALTALLALAQLLLAVALVSLALALALKLAALHSTLRAPLAEPPPPIIARLPPVSIMVALYRESDIAARLVTRLSALDYPRDLLDVVLAVEAEDLMTRKALAAADLPPWMRVVVAPAGRVKTKPRALNLALGQCRGTIIGIYDAEDAPEPDQIRKVVARFHSRGPKVACLQGMLDYYNPLTNWISRCFTIEYASWFRLMLPGVARLGLMVPLGGTTLFFRRSVLEELGGWDAHNVTEDADLGVRLFRHGYRTEIIPTVTREEANCRPVAWVKQRSRWIKGYMMTWLVHMRDPALLRRQVGTWRFIGFQVQFLACILQQLLAPLLWSFWVVPLGLPHPLAESLPEPVFYAMGLLFFLSALTDMGIATLALRRAGHRFSPLWALALYLYFPLATLAAYKALRELTTRPFYWDKTSHGHFDTAPKG